MGRKRIWVWPQVTSEGEGTCMLPRARKERRPGILGSVSNDNHRCLLLWQSGQSTAGCSQSVLEDCVSLGIRVPGERWKQERRELRVVFWGAYQVSSYAWGLTRDHSAESHMRWKVPWKCRAAHASTIVTLLGEPSSFNRESYSLWHEDIRSVNWEQIFFMLKPKVKISVFVFSVSFCYIAIRNS